jgi:hypothetical protein
MDSVSVEATLGLPLVHSLQRPARQHAGLKLIVLPVDLVEPSPRSSVRESRSAMRSAARQAEPPAWSR